MREANFERRKMKSKEKVESGDDDSEPEVFEGYDIMLTDDHANLTDFEDESSVDGSRQDADDAMANSDSSDLSELNSEKTEEEMDDRKDERDLLKDPDQTYDPEFMSNPPTPRVSGKSA